MDNDLRVYAKGKAFEGGVYDLRTLELLISSYRSILDRLIAVQLGRRQLSNAIKKQINYDVKIQEGSVELLLDFVFQHKEILAVLASDGGYQLSNSIVSLYHDAIDLRKKATEFIEKGVKFDIRIVNSFNIGHGNVNSNIEGKEITIADPKILWAAQTTRTPTDRMLSQVDGDSIEHIDLNSRESDLRIDENDRNILGKEKEVLSASLKIIGRLDMIAFSSHRGEIVSDNESFPVTWDEKIRAKMQRIADVDGVIFTVQPVIDHKRLNTEAIGFHVLECMDPQHRLEV